MTLPSGNVIDFDYDTSTHDNALNRVTRPKDSAVTVSRYWYNGMGSVVGTDYPEADVWSRQYSGSTFPDLGPLQPRRFMGVQVYGY